MASLYGTLMFTLPADTKINTQGMLRVLNSYDWDIRGKRWKYSEWGKSRAIYMETADFGDLAYPTLAPLALEQFRSPGDSELADANLDAVSAESGVCPSSAQTNFDFVPHSVLAAQLSEHIEEGYIEMFCIGSESVRYLVFERFRVNADSSYKIACMRMEHEDVSEWEESTEKEGGCSDV